MKRFLVLAGMIGLAIFAAGVFSGMETPARAQDEVCMVDMASALDAPADTEEMQGVARDCKEARCGLCPGTGCKINSICCYNGQIASCGCTAEGEAICSCK